ncbi:MAG: Fe-S cluster assembly protein SufD [Acidimicrobiales bacterium]|nr:Fe-S cluster assembly protein SufD [Acidimicrobiales bacterium]
MSPVFSPVAAGALGGPQWLIDRRIAAAEAFESTPRPDASAEEWRYSRIGELDLDGFTPATEFGNAPMPRLDVEPAALIRCVNGRVMYTDVDQELIDRGVHIGPLAEDENGETRLGSVAADAGDYFTLLNDAFMDWPLLIDIPRGVVIERPIVVTHHAAGDGGAAFPRLVVRVGENAQANVMDLHTSEADDHILMCPVVELDVESAGRLGYLKVQEQGAHTWQFGSVLARAEKDATVSAATAAFGGEYARTRADTRLVGRGAHGDLMAIYFGEGDQTLDFRTYQDHVAPDTTSNLLYKGVVAGESRSIYTGLIRVRPDARGTNAFQTNRNLKLSDKAWAESVPNLEIENNDVKCSHASTVSPVDEEQRFYLESRGVPTDEAERLIVAGFLGEVLANIPVPSAAPALKLAIADKLARQRELESAKMKPVA